MQEPPNQENFNALETFLIRYGIDIGFLISGFFGALLLVSKNSAQKISTTIASILAGTACANYLTPVVMNALPEGVRNNGKYAVAFVMGFMGLKGLELLIDWLFLKAEMQKVSRRKARKSKVLSENTPNPKSRNTSPRKRR